MSREYPEHLNPFRRSALRESFRTIRSAFRKTFRRKPRTEKSETGLPPSLTFPPSQRTADPPDIVLRGSSPINRSSERAKSQDVFLRFRNYDRDAKAATYSPRTASINPFDEDSDEDAEVPKEAVPPKTRKSGAEARHNTTGRRKPKRRAPLPPGLLGNQEHHDSKWSLSSCATDCSYNYNEQLELEETTAGEDLKDIQNITNQIRDLCEKSEDGVEEDAEISAQQVKVVSSEDTKNDLEEILEQNEEKKDEEIKIDEKVLKDAEILENLHETVDTVVEISATAEESASVNNEADLVKLDAQLVTTNDDQNNNHDDSALVKCDKIIMNHADKEGSMCDQGQGNDSQAAMDSAQDCDLSSNSSSDSNKPTPKIRRNKPSKTYLLGVTASP